MVPPLADEIDALATADRLRACPQMHGRSRARATLDGRSVISFCSNDYLGLGSHPALGEAAATAIAGSGFGAGASRLVAGDLPEHRALEQSLADFVALPAALAFSTGYHANLGVLGALARRGDLVVSDAANHASLVDGCHLSRARVVVYRHRDAEAAGRALATPGAFRRRILVTESLFSMDGDLAPLRDLADLCTRHQAALVVDEAHALGVLGPGGRGVCAEAGVVPDALVGTLGKALGAFGGFVAGDRALRAILVNRARTFLYTTAPPPPLAAAASAGVALARGGKGDRLRRRLASHVALVRTALGLPDSPAPILPIVLGDDRRALGASAALRDRGIFVQPIRPPTVPEGTARLRVTLSAAHEPADVERLLVALRGIAP